MNKNNDALKNEAKKSVYSAGFEQFHSADFDEIASEFPSIAGFEDFATEFPSTTDLEEATIPNESLFQVKKYKAKANQDSVEHGRVIVQEDTGPTPPICSVGDHESSIPRNGEQSDAALDNDTSFVTTDYFSATADDNPAAAVAPARLDRGTNFIRPGAVAVPGPGLMSEQDEDSLWRETQAESPSTDEEEGPTTTAPVLEAQLVEGDNRTQLFEEVCQLREQVGNVAEAKVKVPGIIEFDWKACLANRKRVGIIVVFVLVAVTIAVIVGIAVGPKKLLLFKPNDPWLPNPGPLQDIVENFPDYEGRLQAYDVTGTIPTEIGMLTNLVYINVTESSLSGTIPSEIGLLTALKAVVLSYNRLTGHIPSEIGLLTKLEYVELFLNRLTGHIPSEIGSLKKLEAAGLDLNRLTGHIPSEIGSLTKLEEMYLFSNRLTGHIPSEIGSLIKLVYLDISDNLLSGTIPSEIGVLEALDDLYAYLNKLTGSIPSEIGLMRNLDGLFLSNNTLSGSIPSEVRMIKLDYLYLYGNNLTGTFVCPDGIDECFISCEYCDEYYDDFDDFDEERCRTL